MNPPAAATCAKTLVSVVFTEPFRLVVSGPADEWKTSFDDLSSRRYDCTRLNRVSFSIAGAVAGYPAVHLGYDGSLVLIDSTEPEPPEKIVDAINRFLGEVLIGGVYTEAVNVDSVDRGILYQTGFVRIFGMARSSAACLLRDLRDNHAGNFQLGRLFRPPMIAASAIETAWNAGKVVVDQVPELSPSFVTLGVSAYFRHDWQQALASLWIAVEQCINSLWNKRVLSGLSQSETIAGRGKFLRDHRTWTTSAMMELLFQIKAIDFTTYEQLSLARKARNLLSHEGRTPIQTETTAALHGLFRLLSIASTNDGRPDMLLDISNQYEAHRPTITRPPEPQSEPRPITEADRGIWLKSRALPGESNWDGPEFPMMFTVFPNPSGASKISTDPKEDHTHGRGATPAKGTSE
jgi:hypothetical protein